MIATGPPESRPGAKGIAASVVILLAGALIMFAVSRGGSVTGTDLPLLPPLDGDSRAGAESLTIAATPPPSSLGPGVTGPADEAPAYRLQSRPTESIAEALAAALGISAGPGTRLDGPFAVVVDAGTDRILRVENSPGYPWQVLRGDPVCLEGPDSSVSSDGSISCPVENGLIEPDQVGGSEPSAGSGVGGSTPPEGFIEPIEPGSGSGEQVRCPPVDCPEGQVCAQVCPEPELVSPPAEPAPFVELPTPEQAEARAREIIRSLGLEVARSTLSVAPDGSAWQVLAELSVEGIPVVGMETQLSIGENSQVIAGSGMLPEVQLLGSYPLITADEALVRLQQIHSPNNQAQFDGREPAIGAPELALDEQSPNLGSPSPTSVTGMRLVLLLQRARGGPQGGVYLVPAFLVDASDGSVFTVPAAMDEHLTPTG